MLWEVEHPLSKKRKRKAQNISKPWVSTVNYSEYEYYCASHHHYNPRPGGYCQVCGDLGSVHHGPEYHGSDQPVRRKKYLLVGEVRKCNVSLDHDEMARLDDRITLAASRIINRSTILEAEGVGGGGSDQERAAGGGGGDVLMETEECDGQHCSEDRGSFGIDC